jgi:hypothetical protein
MSENYDETNQIDSLKQNIRKLQMSEGKDMSRRSILSNS